MLQYHNTLRVSRFARLPTFVPEFGGTLDDPGIAPQRSAVVDLDGRSGDELRGITRKKADELGKKVRAIVCEADSDSLDWPDPG